MSKILIVDSCYDCGRFDKREELCCELDKYNTNGCFSILSDCPLPDAESEAKE